MAGRSSTHPVITRRATGAAAARWPNGPWRPRFAPGAAAVPGRAWGGAAPARVIRLEAPPVLGAALLGLDIIAPRDTAAAERARSSLTHGAIEWVDEPDATR